MLELIDYNSPILSDINLKIKNDSIILGFNGAGKSSLAQVFVSLIKSNNMYINNININYIDNSRRKELINYIPTSFKIFDDFITVKEFLELSIKK